ncbi:MAG: hypothetical protein HEEMFOPI_01682 [Holosporales bacterium]
MRRIFLSLSCMGASLIFVCILCLMLSQGLKDIFNHNFGLNLLILVLFLSGTVISFLQVFSLIQEYAWINAFALSQQKNIKAPKILSALHILSKNSNAAIDFDGLQNVLDSVDQRLDEKRQLNRYLTGLCVFLGLVGTFWGLSKTITSIAAVISGIDISATDMKQAFENLKSGLQQPLTGMGYAFSSSLFGLTASLILGFLDLNVGRSFAHFFETVQEILTAIVKKPPPLKVENNGPAYQQAVIEQMAETMISIQKQLEKNEHQNQTLAKNINVFVDHIQQLENFFKLSIQHVNQLSEQNNEAQRQLLTFAKNSSRTELTHEFLKNIDQTAKHILGEISTGQQRTLSELTKEIRLICKTLSALANGHE